MGLFGKKQNGGLADVIRCDEPDYLIWKWHPDGTVTGKNKKENAIRFGSSLRVKDGEVAVFVYKQEDGTIQDIIEGPYDQIIETANLPIISGILGLAYAGGTPFQAEIYFINLANIIQTRFAVPFFDVFDPRFLDYSVPVAVRGTINFKIEDYSSFARLNRLASFSLADFQNQIRDAVIRIVKGVVANAPEDNGIPVVQLERKIDEINSIVEERIRTKLYEDFGVYVKSVDIAAIELDKSSDGYFQLCAVTKDISTSKIKAQAEVDIKEMKDIQKLGIFERAGRTFQDIKEDAYERHTKSKASGIVSVTESILAKKNETKKDDVEYNVAVNGQPTGPYDIHELEKMVSAGTLEKSSLLWTKGMSNWEKAVDIEEVKGLFDIMPPIPNTDMPPIPNDEQ